MGWDQVTTDRVVEMHKGGMSRRAIARTLGMGVGKVVGKLYRLGYRDEQRSTQHRNRQAMSTALAKRTGAPSTRRPVENFDALPLPPTQINEDVARKALLDLDRGDCRWPVGDPREGAFGFCALPTAAGRPYCETHCRRARDAKCQPQTAT